MMSTAPRPTILIVNDDQSVLEMLVALLERESYNVVGASNGQQAFELAQKIMPDLVVSDVVMPGMDGLELCRRLKEAQPTASVPVLLASALRKGEHASLQGLETGADDYIEMPLGIQELIVKVARLAERQQVERHYREIVEQAGDIIYTTDSDGRITSINEAGRRFFNLPQALLIGVKFETLVHPEASNNRQARGQIPSNNSSRQTYRFVRSEGDIRFIEVVTTPVLDASESVTGMRGVARDITDRKLVEDQLHRQLNFTSAITNTLAEGVYTLDSLGRFSFVNPAAANMLGWKEKELVGRNVHQTLHGQRPNETGPSDCSMVCSLDSGKTLRGYETEFTRKDGTVFPVSCSVASMKTNEKVTGAVVVFHDITERKRAEEEQARLQAFVQNSVVEWRLTFDAVEYPMLILDMRCRVLKLNRAARELMDKNHREALGQTLDALGEGEPWRKGAELVQALTWTDAAVSAQVQDEMREQTWDITANLVAGPGVGEGRIILMAHNVTRIVEMESTLQRTETMSMMGALVAGVAHEVRNPLFGITSTLDAFDARFGNNLEYHKYIDILRTELERLNELMRDLLEYGKPPATQFYQGQVEEIIVQAVRACDSQAESAKVKLVNNIVGRLQPLQMDRRRMIQVFLNLLENAIHHSKPGDTVTIDAEEVSQDGQDWVDCIIKDSGQGFCAEDLPHIFKPFFTRRRKGSGLGLSIVQRIVDEHGGRIIAGNRPEGGAFIAVRFPVTQRR